MKGKEYSSMASLFRAVGIILNPRIPEPRKERLERMKRDQPIGNRGKR